MTKRKILDYSKRRLNSSEVLRLADDGPITALFKETQLNQFLKNLEGKEIELVPTNAKTEEVIVNMLGGAAMGAGLGFVIAAATTALNPLIGLGAGALLGAGVGLFCTKYKITIKEVSAKGGSTLMQVHLKPI